MTDIFHGFNERHRKLFTTLSAIMKRVASGETAPVTVAENNEGRGGRTLDIRDSFHVCCRTVRNLTSPVLCDSKCPTLQQERLKAAQKWLGRGFSNDGPSRSL